MLFGQMTRVDEDIDKSRWGELESESESEEEESEGEEGEGEIDDSGLVTPGDTYVQLNDHCTVALQIVHSLKCIAAQYQ